MLVRSADNYDGGGLTSYRANDNVTSRIQATMADQVFFIYF